ncbi:hypothetical protein KIN20_000159 [Parelaphostrongylus tenuis]|uniref:Mos1 transposase HTH domain-containing protein n=1 Tax=Parelaphostrongylus tenuis TaxID=148309 RepID=A0AAD5MCV4_PARTN|nr:hypothetical protein KIN20_000159 [Parelaphostrongylus tenuis]
MARMHVFLGVLSVVYFFEAIGGSYLISAIQNIERQFQIPSKLSGLMVSAMITEPSECTPSSMVGEHQKDRLYMKLPKKLIAMFNWGNYTECSETTSLLQERGDIGYIPTVIFVAYFGSRGNRAKWIGSGAFVAAITYFAIASPHFIYPVIVPQANTSEIQARLQPSLSQLSPTASLRELLDYPLIQNLIPLDTHQKLLSLKTIDDHDKEEKRFLMLYESKFGSNAADAARRINKPWRNRTVGESTVRERFREFKAGNEELTDRLRSGRSTNLVWKMSCHQVLVNWQQN